MTEILRLLSLLAVFVASCSANEGNGAGARFAFAPKRARLLVSLISVCRRAASTQAVGSDLVTGAFVLGLVLLSQCCFLPPRPLPQLV